MVEADMVVASAAGVVAPALASVLVLDDGGGMAATLNTQKEMTRRKRKKGINHAVSHRYHRIA